MDGMDGRETSWPGTSASARDQRQTLDVRSTARLSRRRHLMPLAPCPRRGARDSPSQVQHNRRRAGTFYMQAQVVNLYKHVVASGS